MTANVGLTLLVKAICFIVVIRASFDARNNLNVKTSNISKISTEPSGRYVAQDFTKSENNSRQASNISKYILNQNELEKIQNVIKKRKQNATRR